MTIDVVIVDDDAGFRRLARRLLESQGLTVVAEAADGEAAIAVCREHRPTGVLLDVNLPDTTGHVLARELRAELPALRILLTSTEVEAGGVDDVPFVPKLDLMGSDLPGYLGKR